MVAWLGVLVLSSFALASGAEILAHRFGARFVGRTILGVATTLPEIVIVGYASYAGSYGASLGSALGSNVLMMSLGLSVMVLIATTRLAHFPLKEIKVEGFKLDIIFLIVSAAVGAALFWDGYTLMDGLVFLALYLAYLVLAFHESKAERAEFERTFQQGKIRLNRAVAYLIAGTAGIILGAEPFLTSLEGFSSEVSVPSAVVAVILSPIAGEMPEKVSMMILARKGEKGVSISIANILGSKVLNNTLLLAVMLLVASANEGSGLLISSSKLLSFEVYWTAIITILGVMLMFDRKLTRRDGILLSAFYILSITLQFVIPGVTAH